MRKRHAPLTPRQMALLACLVALAVAGVVGAVYGLVWLWFAF